MAHPISGVADILCKLLLMFLGVVCVVAVLGAGFADNKTAIKILISMHVVAFVSTFTMESVFPGRGWKWGGFFSAPAMLLCLGLFFSIVSEGKARGWVWLAIGVSLTIVSCLGGHAKRRLF